MTGVMGYEQRAQPLQSLLDTAPPQSDDLFWHAPPPATAPASADELSSGAAWVVDPTNPGVLRYWDGGQWTGDAMEAPVEYPAVAADVDTVATDPEASEADTSPVEEVPAAAPAAKSPAPAPAPTSPEDREPPAPLFTRGPHYVLGVLPDDEAEHGGHAVVVTGEVPVGYDRVQLECADGTTTEASILDHLTGSDVRVFAAVVGAAVSRVVATRMGGLYGIFVDVSLLEGPGT
jgi:hypothetical protein